MPFMFDNIVMFNVHVIIMLQLSVQQWPHHPLSCDQTPDPETRDSLISPLYCICKQSSMKHDVGGLPLFYLGLGILLTLHQIFMINKHLRLYCNFSPFSLLDVALMGFE